MLESLRDDVRLIKLRDEIVLSAEEASGLNQELLKIRSIERWKLVPTDLPL